MDTRVFITNFSGHDYQVAEKWGKLIPITKGSISYASLDRLKYHCTSAINDSNNEDWLLMSGTNIINVICATIWIIRHNRVKLLVFNKNTQDYVETIIEGSSIEKLFTALQDEFK